MASIALPLSDPGVPLWAATDDDPGPPSLRPRSRRVLAIDDQPDVLDLLRIVLGEEGYRVDVATGGSEALASIERDPPDLILLDLVMPRVDGWEVLSKLRDLPNAPPTLVLTARRDSAAFVKAFHEGATGFVVKPFELDDLVWTCAVVTEHRPRQRERVPERRLDVRRFFFVRLRVRSRGRAFDGALIELSAHGTRIMTSADLEPGASVSVDAELSRGAAPLSLRGEVCWRRNGGSDKSYGLRLSLDDAQTASSLAALFAPR